MMTQFKHPELQAWVPNAYAIITAALGGLVGSCSDTIGRRNVLLVRLVIACIGDIVVATAQSSGAVVASAAISAGKLNLLLMWFSSFHKTKVHLSIKPFD